MLSQHDETILCKGTGGVGISNSGQDIGFVVQNVYKDLIIKHVRVGSIIGRMSIPEEHHVLVSNILAHENMQRYQQATRDFLMHLHQYGYPSDYLLFLQLLEQEDYGYLPKLLRGVETIDIDTHQLHCRLLQFFSQDISEKVDFDLLYRKLVEGEWMEREDSDLLERLSQNNGMSSASKWLVYYVLPKRKENWLKQFLQILRDLDYDGLANWITGEVDDSSKSVDQDSDTDTLSANDTDDDVSAKMNILTVSGEGYAEQNDLDSPQMMCVEKKGPSRFALENLDFNKYRVAEWAETTLPILRRVHREFPDDVSVVSSVEDNTKIDFEEDDIVVTHQLAETRDKVIKILENRPYQDELVRAARAGSNVIIIAPTGSGKTPVALRIMLEHLGRMGDRGKIAFFANELSLVDQQYEMFKGHLQSSVRIMQIVGTVKDKSKVPVSDLIKLNDIVVMTPQIIVDALANKTLESLSVFTMILFDECHHVLSKHPTNRIMCAYMDMKLAGSTGLPQVVGLTASVGVGKKKAGSERDGAVKHIKSLCARLDATGGLITVKENRQSLEEYTNFVETAIKRTKERFIDPFKQCVIDNIMKIIEERMMEKRPNLGFTLDDEITPCLEKGTVKYACWLSQLYYTIIPRISNAGLRQMFITCVQHLNFYNQALMVNENCRARDAMLCIEDAFAKLYPTQQCHGEIENWLFRLYSENHPKLERESQVHVNQNPKLVLLELEIMQQIGKKAGSKILILVKTIALTSALLRWMKETEELKPLAPVVVTGCGSPANKGGMSKAEQIKAVKTFKWGNSRVAIATSVAEEGMDITKCSRVIRYEYVSDEIGMIQARGRASRVEDGTYTLITGDTTLAAREENNFRLEHVMKEAVELIQSEFDQNRHRFRESIEDIQKSDKMARDIEQKHGQQRRKDPNAYNLHCYKCDTFVCQSTDIRVVNNSHHMVMTSNIGSLITEIIHIKPTEFDNIKKHSKIHCKNPKCQMDWGSGVVYKDAKFAVLSLKGLIYYDPNGKQQHRKNWKDVPFSCPEMTPDDLLNYEVSF